MDSKVAGYVQEKILAMLDKGVVPWQKPWTGNGHKNLVSKKGYRGINTWLLEYSKSDNNYTTNWWMTFNQAKAKGWQVRKGEKGTMVIFWKIGKYEKEVNGEIEERKSFLLRYYTVFNANQIEGVELPKATTIEHKPIEEAQAIIDGYVARSGVTFKIVAGNDRACYSRMEDRIEMPMLNQFKSPEEYYSTAFHECVHSTAHDTRLKRFKENDAEFSMSNQSYSFEELVAESGACMLDATVGIDTAKVYENASAYIKTWRDRIAEDVNLVIRASSKAQKAVDMIIGEVEEAQPED